MTQKNNNNTANTQEQIEEFLKLVTPEALDELADYACKFKFAEEHPDLLEKKGMPADLLLESTPFDLIERLMTLTLPENQESFEVAIARVAMRLGFPALMALCETPQAQALSSQTVFAQLYTGRSCRAVDLCNKKYKEILSAQASGIADFSQDYGDPADYLDSGLVN